MKLLVTGATGLLGRALMRELEKNERYSVTGTAFTRARATLERLDLTDTAAVTKYARALRPDMIIHTAAERRPDVSQKHPEKTTALNVAATRTLAAAARDIGAFILYMSTDYVFDGTAPPYSPHATPNPLNLYGRSKRDGEVAVWDETSDACVLRVPVLYGEVETLSESPITVIAENLIHAGPSGTVQKTDNWAVRYPTYVGDVARVIHGISEHRVNHPGFYGTYHWSGNEAFTKYTMARVIAKIIGISGECVQPDDGPPAGAPRPKDSHLDCSELESIRFAESIGFTERTLFEEQIALVLKPFL